MNHLLNHMFLASNRHQMNIGYTDLGIITSVNPSDYTVKVLIQPQDMETGFIPYCTPFYGFVAPPKGGEQCLVLYHGGNNNVPIAALLIYWDNGRVQGQNQSGDIQPGEILLKNQSGSYIKLSNDGTITIKAINGIVLDTDNTECKGNVIIDNNLTANSGSINMTNGNFNTSQDVIAGTISLKTHVHSDPQGGDTGPPIS